MIPRNVIHELPPYVAGVYEPGAIKLSGNENPLGPSPRALGALRSIDPDEIRRYPDGGVTALAEAIATHHGVAPGQVICGNGSDEVIMMIAATFCRPGTNVVLPAPTFSQYRFGARVFDAAVRTVPLVDGYVDLQAMLDAVDAATSVVFVCDPNNPTGTHLPSRLLGDFARSLPQDAVLVVDQAYGEYAESDDYAAIRDILSWRTGSVVLRTFSKIYGLAGLRVGYGIGSAAVIDLVQRVRQPFNVSVPAQAAARAALADGGFVERSRANNRSGMRTITEMTATLGLPYFPSSANFVCFEPGPSARETFAAFRDRGILIRPLDSFGLPHHVRVTIGTSHDVSLFVRTLRSFVTERYVTER